MKYRRAELIDGDDLAPVLALLTGERDSIRLSRGVDVWVEWMRWRGTWRKAAWQRSSMGSSMQFGLDTLPESAPSWDAV